MVEGNSGAHKLHSLQFCPCDNRSMRFWAPAMFLLTCAHAQQLEFLNQKVDGKAARDQQGNWIFAERLPAGVRVRKLSPGLTQTVFDIATAGSGPAGISALQVH